MFFHAWSSKTSCHLLVFSKFFGKISSLSLCFFFFLKKKTFKKEVILFTLSLYFFFLIRSLFVCLLVMFTLPRCYSSCWKFCAKRILCLTVLLRRFFQERSSFFFFHSLPLKKSIFANNYSFLLFYLFLWKNFLKKSSVFFGKNQPFFITFCFCSSRFAFTSVFHFRFCLIFGFSWSPSSWTHLYFTSLSSVWTTTISPSCCFFFFFQKNFSNIHFTCMGCLLMSFCSNTSPVKKNLFVHFLFWCTFSWVFVFACLSSFFRFFILLFYSYVFWNIFLFLLSFLNVFLCWSLFIDLFFLVSLFGLIIVFSRLLTLPSSQKSNVFWIASFCICFCFNKNCVPSLLVLWERNVPLCFLFLLVFLFSENLKKILSS